VFFALQRYMLFDPFDTLLLLEDIEVYYSICLDKVYDFLLNHVINISYEVFKKTCFRVRDEIVAKASVILE
jgi:hypothetical protein